MSSTVWKHVVMSQSLPAVLVVGAGPAGLVTALTLLKNGISVRIIEKEELPRVGQRGAGIMGIQPRSMELFNLLGVWPDILAAGAKPPQQMRVYKMPCGVEPIITFYLDPPVETTPSTPFVNTVLLGQDHLESVICSHLAQHGCHVELGTRLTRFEQHADSVVAHVVKKQGDEEVNDIIVCRWLVGTDGAKGVSRKELGLSFPGSKRDTSQHLIIGDIEVRGLNREHWHIWGDVDTIFLTLRPIPEDEDKGMYSLFMGGRMDFPKVVAERSELVRILRAGSGRNELELGAIKWLSEYKAHERIVDRFGEDRVFLAGDAAHVHSPFGGQGLNSSVQDSANLAWKLALVEKGLAAPSLLTTYTIERLPVVSEMLQTSSKLFDQTVAAKRDGNKSEKAWYRGGHLHQLGVNYRWSSIVLDERFPQETHPVDPYGAQGSASKIVRAGERAPDAPGLVEVNISNDDPHKTISLFQIFGVAYHTVLLFTDDISQIQSALHDLRAYPREVIRSAIVLARDQSLLQSKFDGLDHVLFDQHGHAYAGYAVPTDAFTLVIIRPDSVVGGILLGSEGLKTYFGGVFSEIPIEK